MRVEDLLQKSLQLRVETQGQVGPRRRELGAIAHGRLDGALLQARIEFQTEVATGAEVNELLATHEDRSSIENLVLCDEMNEAPLGCFGEYEINNVHRFRLG